jgi:hypothetical protein
MAVFEAGHASSMREQQILSDDILPLFDEDDEPEYKNDERTRPKLYTSRCKPIGMTSWATAKRRDATKSTLFCALLAFVLDQMVTAMEIQELFEELLANAKVVAENSPKEPVMVEGGLAMESWSDDEREEQRSATVQLRAARGHLPGGMPWRCSCGNENGDIFGNCYQCKTPKPQETALPVFESLSPALLASSDENEGIVDNAVSDVVEEAREPQAEGTSADESPPTPLTALDRFIIDGQPSFGKRSIAASSSPGCRSSDKKPRCADEKEIVLSRACVSFDVDSSGVKESCHFRTSSLDIIIKSEEFFAGARAALASAGVASSEIQDAYYENRLSKLSLYCITHVLRGNVPRPRLHKFIDSFYQQAREKQERIVCNLKPIGVFLFAEHNSSYDLHDVTEVEDSHLDVEGDMLAGDSGDESSVCSDTSSEVEAMVETKEETKDTRESSKPEFRYFLRECWKEWKGKRRQMRKTSGYSALIPKLFVACVPQQVLGCRATEDGLAVYSVAFGRRTNKPPRLFRIDTLRAGVRILYFFAMRSNGVTYYSTCEEPYTVSPFVDWLLHAMDSHQDFFSRLLLALTPTKKFVAISPNTIERGIIDIEIKEVKKNTDGTDPVEGIAFGGLEAFLQAKIIDRNTLWCACHDPTNKKKFCGSFRRGATFPAHAIRALVWTGTETILVKGVLMLVAGLGKKIIINDSMVKARTNLRLGNNEIYGVHMTSTSAQRYSPPCLTSSLVATLFQKAQSFATATARETGYEYLVEMIGKCQKYTEEVLPSIALGDRPEPPEMPKCVYAPEASNDADEDSEPEWTGWKYLKNIHVHHTSEALVETPMDALENFTTTAAPPPGTKTFVSRASSAFTTMVKKLRRKPRLYMPGWSAWHMAVADPHEKLRSDQVYVINLDGSAYIGGCSVGRYPSHSMHDLKYMEAVEPPPHLIRAPGTIYFSQDGRGNSDLAGGDLDGDYDFVCFLGVPEGI